MQHGTDARHLLYPRAGKDAHNNRSRYWDGVNAIQPLAASFGPQMDWNGEEHTRDDSVTASSPRALCAWAPCASDGRLRAHAARGHRGAPPATASPSSRCTGPERSWIGKQRGPRPRTRRACAPRGLWVGAREGEGGVRSVQGGANGLSNSGRCTGRGRGRMCACVSEREGYGCPTAAGNCGRPAPRVRADGFSARPARRRLHPGEWPGTSEPGSWRHNGCPSRRSASVCESCSGRLNAV